MKIEKRQIPIDIAEFRAEQSEGGMVLEGFAALYNRWSGNLGGFKEIIRPGAFKGVLEEDVDCRLLVNHEPSLILSRTKNGTLELSESDKGLYFRGNIIDTQSGRDTYAMIKSGLIDQCSFAFTVAKDGESWSEEKNLIRREITSISGLYDVSCVTYPAYSATSVSARSLMDHVGIDIDALTALFVRKQSGGDITDARPTIDSAIAAIRSLLPELPVDKPMGHEEHTNMDADNLYKRLNLMARRLELLRH